MAEPRLSVVRRDLRGVAKAMKGLKFSGLPDLCLAVDIVVRSLESCVVELESIQLEVKSQGDNLGDHLLEHLRLEKRVSDLETQTGLERAMEES